eukprot:TRINITY_DN526_c0_g1_i1.p3 TRINITY_DN526_c0_g1~~TRINITY_DN526_c0_g1_i1.p3  ORF type:complete len:110 (+),score=3.38 TRINITY_DN526_c0_g1_i1:156-485(+)
MGKPVGGQTPSSRKGREPPELKHLSRARKREDSASSGERKRRSPNQLLRRLGLQDSRMDGYWKWNDLGRSTIEGESPVDVQEPPESILSTTIHANIVGNWGAHPPRLNT